MNQPYVILARKYRPQHFNEVVGQKAIVTTIVQGLKSGRLAQAWLMCGPSGVGKTTLARILARCLNCTAEDQVLATPCDNCPSCKGILNNESLDLLEIDGASNNRVDEVRQLQEHMVFRPQYSRYRIVLIDEVHMLSTAAFNALLKTLEEPPEHVKFILATTEPDRILPTVRARCQRFDFFSVSVADLSVHIKNVAKKEKIKLEKDCAEVLAELAGGSVRNALSLLDQLGSDGEVNLESVRQLSGQALPEHVRQLCHLVWDGSPRAAIQLIDRLANEAVDLTILVEQWLLLLRQALEQKMGAIEHEMVIPHNVTLQSLIYQGKFVSNLLRDLAHESAPRMALILSVSKLATQEDLRPLVDLIDKLPPNADTLDVPAVQEVVPLGPEPLDDVEDVEEVLVKKVPAIKGALSLELLRENLEANQHRAAASFLKGSQMHVQGKSVTFDVAQPGFLRLLDTPANRQAIIDVLEKFIPSVQLSLDCRDAVIHRSEDEEASAEAPVVTSSEEMEKKVIDMFDGEKLN